METMRFCIDSIRGFVTQKKVFAFTRTCVRVSVFLQLIDNPCAVFRCGSFELELLQVVRQVDVPAGRWF